MLGLLIGLVSAGFVMPLGFVLGVVKLAYAD